ncbi:MAG: hypothetical protein ACREHD_28865, partial [Pirellulales bacterium]
MAWLAARHSPTIHEMAHLPAGICHWQYGMFELYRVNPPLPRMVAALPVLFCRPKTDRDNSQLDPLSCETIPTRVRFARANGGPFSASWSLAGRAFPSICWGAAPRARDGRKPSLFYT